MKKNSAEFIAKLVAIAVAAFIVINFTRVSGFLSSVFKIIQPILIGVVLAMTMGVPLNFFEKKVLKKISKPKLKEFLTLLFTFVLLAGVLALIGFLIIPQGVKSVKEITEKLTGGDMLATLNEIKGWDKLRPVMDSVISVFSEKIGEYLPRIIGVLQDIFTGIYNVLFGFIISVMLIVNRRSVKLQLKKVISLVFKQKDEKVRTFLIAASKKFSSYLGGQCTEALILGSACYVTMIILKVPYAALVSLIVGIMNIIPIFGAYIGGFVCTMIVFAASPVKAVIFLVALLVLQQVEGFTTYPVIVGKYVGLNGFWITVSIIIWGGIFGFWGLFLGVPLSAFLFDIFENYYDKKKTENKFLSSLDKGI